MKKLDKIILIGIGNNTRHDDGLGWEFINSVEAMNLGFSEDQLCCKYQLMVEDAEEIAEYDTVIFIDACKTPLKNGFEIEEIVASEQVSFSTHAVPPNQILNLCNSIYNKFPKAYVIKIYGEQWEIKIGLSEIAEENLKKSCDAFLLKLEEIN